MLRIVTDGAGDMPAEWLEAYDLQIIPINIQFKEQTFLQGIDLSNEDFYRLVDQSGVIPNTSQPTPQQFVDFYRRVAKAGDTILSMHVTAKLSGTYESAIMASRELEGVYRVIPFDSATGSAGLGFLCKEARLMDRGGASIEEILQRMESLRESMHIVLTLDTLEYAKMSGRIKAMQAALASLLNVKPIAILDKGVLYMAEKVRTRQRSLERVLELMQKRMEGRRVNVAVVQARDPKAGKTLSELVPTYLDCQELIMTELSIAVTANLGPGTVGVVAYPV